MRTTVEHRVERGGHALGCRNEDCALELTGSERRASRDSKALRPKPRDIYVPDLHIDTLKVKARKFR
jgi:hypothetical protein